MIKKIYFIFSIQFLFILFSLNFSKLYPENKKYPIDFSKYEINETYFIDCPKKKECFKNCSNTGSAMPYKKFDQFNTNDQILRNECTRKCNEIICTDQNK
ncbi:Hypothetical protein LBF_2148 [Leptospira biflexa serovar Patoc strain 'Patoc 1 (Ames)']|uniref:Uncharacterized protein n=1 Tax=Leptospira biflexa serovar Patoc (strain Patoc 1 / ATCC 23582 / Paris) TaxID=456481 RepID=B0ST68_LEPBP|nr:hypothetical protein [Leptospira biflexa]ABZ94645.1 Hypothetical protein LBF_2148 [Leptospira biflexa serovar Patoc strain 'Patoc 1 (Ames)']ABZ98308.1 Hypothetical protein LEPBI_I2210 [Leptospira biflexa serovar Patoc strain 'Patoc 1 (Paris)']